MKIIGTSQTRKISLLTIVACATMLAACGGGGSDYDSGGANGGDNDAGATTISAAPALLGRSCDGQQSPHLFCPAMNGG